MYKQPKFFKAKCEICGKEKETEMRLKPGTERKNITHMCNDCYNNRPKDMSPDEFAQKYMSPNETWYPEGTIPIHLEDNEMIAGNIITIKEPYDLDISKNGDSTLIAHVKAGDKFIINRIGCGTFLTGEAIGKTQRIDDKYRKFPLDVNVDATIDFVLNDLDCFCNLKEILKEHDVNKDDFTHVIREALKLIRI
jgi:hypothetical protein